MKHRPLSKYWLYHLVVIIFTPLFVHAQEQYSPYAEQNYPNHVYWGDTHVHTNMSADAFMSDNKTLGPDEAYRFARGDTIVTDSGMRARLHRPLDFLAVADHVYNIGVMLGLEASDPALMNTETGKYWRQQWLESRADEERKGKLFGEMWRNPKTAGYMKKNIAFRTSAWGKITASADKYNDPGKFTAFIGYEWTPTPVGKDAFGPHRVVIYKDAADKANQVLPFTKYDSTDPEKLWAFMQEYEKTSGGEILGIPHNGNLTGGGMFTVNNFNGRPLNKAYAETRSRWEPLYEVTQMKGDGEAHPVLSPTDEFADYETWNQRGWADRKPGPEWAEEYKQEYARSGLKLGLQQQAKLGVNPFKFGMIGSTDSHTSLATSDDNNFWGKFSALEPNPDRMFKVSWGWKISAAGYAAVWAKENTREALFAAMKRKEVYASTGPRMTVRFFGGWDYEKDDAFKPDLAGIGYAKGVPMGGDLTNAPNGKSPNFLIRAVKDPDGANIDRVQVIKGWHDKKGELHEKVYNVALSDKRKESWRGNVKPVGSTVDIKDASYTNAIGDPELSVVWKDPDFNQDELAFYYVRVLEIPTPRWTAYDVKFFELKDVTEEVPMVTQERAYTSPIWYSPKGQ